MHDETLFDALPVALLQIDDDGRVVRLNAAAARLLGPPAGGSEASPAVAAPWKLTTPDGTPCSVAGLAASLVQQAPGAAATVFFETATGQSVPLDATARRIESPSGHATVLAFHDASARLRAEADRRAVQERMDRSQEIAHLGSWELDLIENRLSWSDEVYRIFGLQPQQFGATYEAFLEVVHPDDRAAVNDAYSGSVRDGRDSYEIEHRIVRRSDAAVRVVHERCQHVRDGSGRIVRSIGMVHDVTERKRAEEVLRQSEGRERVRAAELQAVLDTVPAAVFVARDPEAKHIEGNRYCQEVLGLPGGNISMSAPPGERKTSFRLTTGGAELNADDLPLQQAVSTGKEVRGFEFDVVYPDGTSRTLFGDATPFHDADGSVGGAVAAAVDITERKKAEDLLREKSAQLAHADRIKDEFLATLSHELRTPLSTILVWAHLLVHTELDEASRRRAQEVILASASAQKEIIDEVLDVSRIISGKMSLNVGEVAVEVVLAAALDVVRPAAVAKQLRLEVHAEPNLLVLGDAGRLQQVLWNLLANAVKFSEEGGAVHVDASRDGASVRVAVADTGVGISAEFLPHVFDRFAQQDASPGRQYGGLGLGLAIARHLVELHGGSIEADSPGPGRGSTFTITLPARVRRRRAEADAAGKPQAPSATQLAGVRVLVVDDEPDAREVTGTALQQVGAQVTLAGGAGEALECLQDGQYDVLVADIAMPGTDGYALMAAIRDLDAAVARIPALALSAYGRESDRRRALAAGFDHHISKPATPAQLTEVIRKLLGNRASRQP